jgi:putative sigma-54 modulation protein
MKKSDEFANEGYTIYIQGKHLEITDAIKSYVWDKLARIERISDKVIDVHVTLEAQKLEQSCSILMNFIHFQIKVSAYKSNMYEAIDKAVDKVVKLIRRYKTKLQSYRNKDLTTVDIHVNVIKPLGDELSAINDEIEAENAARKADHFKMHEIVANETMRMKTLTQEEAVMKMEITDDPFMIFRSEEDQKLKVIYRRPDHQYNLVHIQT